MKSRNISIAFMLFFCLMTISISIALQNKNKTSEKIQQEVPSGSTTVTETTIISDYTVFLINPIMQNSKVDEFYHYLHTEDNKLASLCFYVKTLDEIAASEEILECLSHASEVILIEIPLSFETTNIIDYSLNDFATVTKHIASSTPVYYVDLFHGAKKDELRKLYTRQMTFLNKRKKWQENQAGICDPDNYKEEFITDCERHFVITGSYAWYCMCHNGRFTEQELGIEDANRNPNILAGYSLALYLQYKINNNTCKEHTFDDIVKYIPEMKNYIDQADQLENGRLLIANEISFDDDFDLNGREQIEISDCSDLYLSYQTKSLHFYDSTYFLEYGFHKLEKRPNGKPSSYSCFFDNDQLFLYRFEWKEDHFEQIRQQIELPVSMVLDIHYDLKTCQDADGNWYMGGSEYETNKYYIYRFNQDLQFEQRVCISDILPNVNHYLLYDKNKILVQSTETAGMIISDKGEKSDRFTMEYIYLIDLEQQKIIKQYDIGIPLYSIHLYNDKLYAFTMYEEYIVEVDLEIGKLTKSIHVKPLLQTLQAENTLENVYDLEDEPVIYYNDFIFDLLGNHLYLLTGYGLCKINLANGECQRLIDAEHIDHHNDECNYAYELTVLSDSEIYICAGYADDDFIVWLTIYTSEDSL